MSSKEKGTLSHKPGPGGVNPPVVRMLARIPAFAVSPARGTISPAVTAFESSPPQPFAACELHSYVGNEY